MQSRLFVVLCALCLLGAAPDTAALPTAGSAPAVPVTTLPTVPAEVLDPKNCNVRFSKIDASAVTFHDLAFVGKDVYFIVDVNRFQGRLPLARDARFGVAYIQLDAGPGLYTTADFQPNRRVIAFHDLSSGRHRLAMALLSGTNYVPVYAQCFDVP